MGEKRWRSRKEPASESRRAAESSGLMAASRSVIRKEENHQMRRKEVDHRTRKREAFTAIDADLTSVIGQLPSHLWSMVSLLAQTVSPSVEGKMMKKRGKATLEQATSMLVAISYSSFKKTLLTFSSVVSSLIVFLLSNVGCYGSGLGSLRFIKVG